MKTNQIGFRRIFYGKWLGEIPRGIGFGSPDAGESFWYAPDAGPADIVKNRKNPKVVISPRRRFSHKWWFHFVKTTNRKDGNHRKDHEKISCFHQNLISWWYLQINFLFVMQTRIFVFLYGYFISWWNHVLARGCRGRRLLLQTEELSSQQPLALLN